MGIESNDPVSHYTPFPPDLKDRVAALERAVPNVPPIFHHLFALLPKPGEEFPVEKRLTFLRAMAHCADLTYGPTPLSLTIEWIP